MIKKLSNLFFLSAASFLLMFGKFTLTTASFIHHGEPDCPEELLK